MGHDEPPKYPADFLALVQRAIGKRRQAQKLTREEQRALTRYQADEDERARWKHYRSIPKKDWVALSGRQHKILDDQARRYGLPIAGESIDLQALAQWLHGFLAENGRRLLQPETENDLLGGGDGEASPALELLRKESWRIKRLERQQLEGELLSRSAVHDVFGALAGRLRLLGEQLQRQHGADALELLNETLDDCDRLVERHFGQVDRPNEGMTDEQNEGADGDRDPRPARQGRRAGSRGDKRANRRPRE